MNNDLMMCARPGGKWYGAEYDGSLDVKDIAKMIRKELKANFPGFKFSVNIDRYSGGASIRAGLVEVPEDFKMVEWSEEYFRIYGRDGIAYSEELKELFAAVKEIGERWNYDDSNSMVDYFSVNYYFFESVKFGSPAYEKEKAERAVLEAAKEAA